MSTNSPILEARGVSVSFGGLRALHDVYLDLHRNEVVGVIGGSELMRTFDEDGCIWIGWDRSPRYVVEYGQMYTIYNYAQVGPQVVRYLRVLNPNSNI